MPELFNDLPIIFVPTGELHVKDQPMPELSQEAKEGLKKSIAKFGIIYPLVVKKTDQGYEIQDGRTRYDLGRELGHTVFRCELDTSDSPERKVIKYDVEVYRRNLSEADCAKFIGIRNAELRQVEQTVLQEFLKNVIPEYHSIILQHHAVDPRKAETLARTLSVLPHDLQKELGIPLETPATVTESIGEKGAIEERIRELEEEASKLKESKKGVEAQLQEAQGLIKSFKANFESALDLRLEKMRTELTETLSAENKSAEDIARQIEDAEIKARQEAEKEFKKDIDEMNTKLVEMSKRLQSVNRDLSSRDDEIKGLKAAVREKSELAQKYFDESSFFKTMVTKIKKPEEGIKALGIAGRQIDSAIGIFAGSPIEDVVREEIFSAIAPLEEQLAKLKELCAEKAEVKKKKSAAA
jgi:hypothetical protein